MAFPRSSSLSLVAGYSDEDEDEDTLATGTRNELRLPVKPAVSRIFATDIPPNGPPRCVDRSHRPVTRRPWRGLFPPHTPRDGLSDTTTAKFRASSLGRGRVVCFAARPVTAGANEQSRLRCPGIWRQLISCRRWFFK